MLSEYYDLREWGEEGIPRQEKLEALGLADAFLGKQTRER
jgi:aldehyde:ferredoxin oxidoreductase